MRGQGGENEKEDGRRVREEEEGEEERGKGGFTPWKVELINSRELSALPCNF